MTGIVFVSFVVSKIIILLCCVFFWCTSFEHFIDQCLICFVFFQCFFPDPKQPAIVPIPNSHGLLNSAKSRSTNSNFLFVFLSTLMTSSMSTILSKVIRWWSPSYESSSSNAEPTFPESKIVHYSVCVLSTCCRHFLDVLSTLQERTIFLGGACECTFCECLFLKMSAL